MQWKEQIAANEAARFERYAQEFVELQKRKSQEFGNGRALHRKQIIALRATFEVLPDLPEPARHGLFGAPESYDAWVRLSNGSADRAADAKSDIRGFAIKVFGVSGPSATSSQDTASQDFLLINHSTFAFAKSDEFVGLTLATLKGVGALLKHLLNRYGLLAGIGLVGRLAGVIAEPFGSFACENFYSAAPIACGPYAARLRLIPVGNPPPAEDTQDWARDIRGRLAQAPLTFEFQLQFFSNEACTPIEDASVDWQEALAPYVTVARLTIPRQELTDAAARQFDAQVEAAGFDPWMALMAHRPLGEVMRARKVIYLASRNARRAP
jgi:hypothetical protein